jgi:hypothetical protein
MTDFTVNMPSTDELETLREENPTNVHSYPAPREGYVRGTTVAKELNRLLKEAGREDKAIKSQMVYNYVRKGYIKTDEANYPHIAVETAESWIKVQLARRTAS